MPRIDDRRNDELRPVGFTEGIAPHAVGSVLVSFGDTRVICAASVQDRVPRWMQVQNVPGGWLTAEYSMLPYSTLDRKDREISKGKADGRGIEIQRLIGRSLRTVVDLGKLGSRTLWVDCDVLQADGGTRTASITGGCVAVAIACERMVRDGVLAESPLRGMVAAVSAGVVGGEALLDLNYAEDKEARVDFNLVMTGDGRFVEVQGGGEGETFSDGEFVELVDLGRKGIGELVEAQRTAVASALADGGGGGF